MSTKYYVHFQHVINTYQLTYITNRCNTYTQNLSTHALIEQLIMYSYFCGYNNIGGGTRSNIDSYNYKNSVKNWHHCLPCPLFDIRGQGRQRHLGTFVCLVPFLIIYIQNFTKILFQSNS